MRFDLASLDDYDAVIDVRTPAEFAQDHIPGAENMPVLDDGERHDVGQLYSKDAFAARRLGLAHVARNLARMASDHLDDKDSGWRPLVYCWRGGMRSASVVDALRKVGWRADALPGGYKSYRASVIAALDTLPARLSWVVLCGPTGSGKTLLLDELRRQGGQTLDLEGLANHRGSLFGELGAQPSQRAFESAVSRELGGLDSARRVYVESESRMIGRLRVPDGLLERMHAGTVVAVEAGLADRARLTARDYAAFTARDSFVPVAERLVRYVGRRQVSAWLELLEAGRHEELAASILASHYDRLYARSLARNFGARDASPAAAVQLDPLDDGQVAAAAAQLLQDARDAAPAVASDGLG